MGKLKDSFEAQLRLKKSIEFYEQKIKKTQKWVKKAKKKLERLEE